MIIYEKSIKKSIKKGQVPQEIITGFHNAFLALDLTKDLSLFDIKQLKGKFNHIYYRLRKGKYRAIFYVEKNNFFIINIAKREEVYNQWE